jgi:hypothetical protein
MNALMYEIATPIAVFLEKIPYIRGEYQSREGDLKKIIPGFPRFL